MATGVIKQGSRCKICRMNVCSRCVSVVPSCDSGDRSERHGRLHLKMDIYQKRCHIDIFKAENLPPMDLTGSSDPYVILTLEPKPKKKISKMKTTVKDKCLNPVWNESFVVDVS